MHATFPDRLTGLHLNTLIDLDLVINSLRIIKLLLMQFQISR
jgi:hypothetical protein